MGICLIATKVLCDRGAATVLPVRRSMSCPHPARDRPGSTRRRSPPAEPRRTRPCRAWRPRRRCFAAAANSEVEAIGSAREFPTRLFLEKGVRHHGRVCSGGRCCDARAVIWLAWPKTTAQGKKKATSTSKIARYQGHYIEPQVELQVAGAHHRARRTRKWPAWWPMAGDTAETIPSGSVPDRNTGRPLRRRAGRRQSMSGSWGRYYTPKLRVAKLENPNSRNSTGFCNRSLCRTLMNGLGDRLRAGDRGRIRVFRPQATSTGNREKSTMQPSRL